MPLPSIAFRLRDATAAAKVRTGDKSLGTQAQSGFVRVVRVTYDASGGSTITPLTDYISAERAIEALNAL